MIEDEEEIDELDTLEGHYGTDGYPYSEDDLEEWLNQQNAEDNRNSTSVATALLSSLPDE
jgi:hypothetical protein